MRTIGHFIGGREVKGTSGRFADVFQPMTGDVQAQVALAGPAWGAGSVAVFYGLYFATGQAIFAGTGNVSQAYDQNGNYVGGGPAPTRAVTMETLIFASGANWMNSNSLRRKRFGITAQSRPRPADAPYNRALLPPALFA